MAHAATIARGIAGTPFVPKALRVLDRGQVDVQATTANIAAALLTGRELGMEPMAALRSIHVIDGTPALSALALRALVIVAGHEIWVEESTATRAIVNGARRGTGTVQSSTWTIDRAGTAGLAGKDNWRKQPTAMLIARATSECARLVAPEALLGMPYSVEELADEADLAETPGEPETKPATRTARRRRIPPAPAAARTLPPVVAPPPAPPEDEPGFDDGASANGEQPGTSAVIDGQHSATRPQTEDDPPPAELITDAQMRAMQAAFRDLGISDRGDRLEQARAIIGRDIESSKQMYRAEASAVIDELTQRKTRAALEQADAEARRQADEDAQLEAAYWAETRQQQLSDEPPLDET